MSVVFKLIIVLITVLLGCFQTLYYMRLKSIFSRLPIITGTITHSRLLNQQIYEEDLLEATISFEYQFQGDIYESTTPCVRGYDLFPSYTYESALVKKYKVGDIVNARVLSNHPHIAYLEVAPLSKLSAILVPLSSIAIAIIFLGIQFEWWESLYHYLAMQIDIALVQQNNAGKSLYF